VAAAVTVSYLLDITQEQQMATGIKRISLGLQGGGSLGAFGWGVLDRLLADERLEGSGLCRSRRRTDISQAVKIAPPPGLGIIYIKD
jgi:hypothetical protein